MKCPKQERRTIFSFFKIFSCPCKLEKEDELIIVGNNFIHIIYTTNACSFLIDEDENDMIVNNQKSNMFFKLLSKFNQDLILLWLEDIRYLDYYFDIFESLLDDNVNIIILANK